MAIPRNSLTRIHTAVSTLVNVYNQAMADPEHADEELGRGFSVLLQQLREALVLPAVGVDAIDQALGGIRNAVERLRSTTDCDDMPSRLAELAQAGDLLRCAVNHEPVKALEEALLDVYPSRISAGPSPLEQPGPLRSDLLQDGAIPPDRFRLLGWTIKGLTPSELRLLGCLWGEGKYPPVCVTDAARRVYGAQHYASEDKLDRHRKALKRKLEKQSDGVLSCWLKGGMEKGIYQLMVDGQPVHI